MWYLCDDATTYFSRAVQDVLSKTYDSRTGKGGPHCMASTHTWLESSGFLPVGTPKSTCSPVDNEEALHHRIVDACQTVRNYPGIYEQMTAVCDDMCWGVLKSHRHFEHLL
jgi:hypothetical protein